MTQATSLIIYLMVSKYTSSSLRVQLQTLLPKYLIVISAVIHTRHLLKCRNDSINPQIRIDPIPTNSSVTISFTLCICLYFLILHRSPSISSHWNSIPSTSSSKSKSKANEQTKYQNASCF